MAPDYEAETGELPFTFVQRIGKAETCRGYMDVGARAMQTLKALGIGGTVWLKRSEHSKQMWKVKLTQRTSRTPGFISTGWSSFARDNDLREGEYLVIKVVRRDMFIVKIKSELDCMKHCPGKNRSSYEQVKGMAHQKLLCAPPVTDKRSQPQNLQIEPHRRDPSSDLPGILVSAQELQPSRADVSNPPDLESPRTLTRAHRPLCYVQMEAVHLASPCFMEMPRGLAKYISQISHTVRLLEQTGRSWEMRWSCVNGRGRLEDGWEAFARDYDLEVGDICIFALADLKDQLMVDVYKRQRSQPWICLAHE